MVVSQYPYQLWMLLTQEASRVAGNYVPQTASWVLVSDCRDQVNSGTGKVTLADGVAYVFSAVIHLPLPVPSLAEGTLIEVRDGDTVRQKGAIKRVHAGLLHGRLWL